MSLLLQTLLTFLLTVVAGGAFANRWQRQRSAESRLFDASNVTYQQMLDASDRFVSLIGNRIYSSQRVVLLDPINATWPDAVADYRLSIIEWNKALIGLELRLKTLFRTVRAQEIEPLQSDLRTVNLLIERKVRGEALARPTEIELHRQLAVLRFAYFAVAERMIAEARLLFREMHFGVKERYLNRDLSNFSTWQLTKLLFQARSDELSVTRSPMDLGRPVSAGDSRFGID